MLEHCLIATAHGAVGLAWNTKGVARLQLPDVDRTATLARLCGRIESREADPPDWLAPTVVRLQAYFLGTPTDFRDCPLDLEGVPDLHLKLYAGMLKLGWGETVTYGELAGRVGMPGAAQAVGRAMGLNPIPVIIPCHRVLAAGNRMGGFSAPGGARTKLRLLDLEGVWLGSAPGQMAFAF